VSTREDEHPGTAASVARTLKLRDRRLRLTVLSILGIGVLVLMLLAPIFQEVEALAGVAAGVAITVVLLGILLDYGAEVESALAALRRTVRDVDERVASHEKRLIRIDEHVSEVAREKRLEVFGNEEDATPRQLEFVRNNPMRFVRLCEYSTLTIQPLMRCLAEREGLEEIQLLMARPSKASPYQAQSRLPEAVFRLAHRFPKEDARRRGLRIRCWSEPPSMRGRNYNDDLIVVGWYTYHCKRPELGRKQIWGDENALVWTPCRGPEGERMRDMFEDVFHTSWETAQPLAEAWAPLLADGLRERHPEFPSDDWLAEAS
jgi:hypothetical protein